MSVVKKSKLDLLVRVRYSNPLPPPPCPPKLLNIPTDPHRYTKIGYVNELANETPLPMIIDAECGMPLDLSQWESLWTENADDSDLNPNPENLPALDPKDAWLVAEAPSHNGPNGQLVSGLAASSSNNVHVPWLRKTEYISRETVRPTQNLEIKLPHDFSIDISLAAQIGNIETSFQSVAESFDLSTLKHPGKNNVKAVESWEVFPDDEIWANAYDLFKFSERPGDRSTEVDDPRLECALLRPMESDGEHFLAYYLVKDDASIKTLAEQRAQVPPDGDDDSSSPHTVFQFIRDYETVKIEQDIANEFLLVFHDGNDVESPDMQRPKAAYYKNIERKINVKKKRVNRLDAVAYTDKWDAIQLSHTPFSKEELDERTDTLQEVTDPLYLFPAENDERPGAGDLTAVEEDDARIERDDEQVDIAEGS